MRTMRSRRAGAFALAVVACWSAAWALDAGRPQEGGVHAERLPSEVISRWLGKEFGDAVVSGASHLEGMAYSYREGSYTRVVGRMVLTCRDEDAAGKLFRVASTRRNFRTRKILTIYVVEREGKVVRFHYREGVGRIADDEGGCDVKCQFDALQRSQG